MSILEFRKNGKIEKIIDLTSYTNFKKGLETYVWDLLNDGFKEKNCNLNLDDFVKQTEQMNNDQLGFVVNYLNLKIEFLKDNYTFMKERKIRERQGFYYDNNLSKENIKTLISEIETLAIKQNNEYKTNPEFLETWKFFKKTREQVKKF